VQTLRYAAWRVEEMTCVRPEYSLTAPFDGLMVLSILVRRERSVSDASSDVLRITGVRKSFGATRALAGVEPQREGR
jgi:hypothetical protein